MLAVDPEDHEKCRDKTWYLSDKKGRGRVITKIGGKKIAIANFILDYNGSLTIDHIDGNIYNNRRSNLREATREQQARNRRKFKNTKSKYKGVYYMNQRVPWVAQIMGRSRKAICLGFFLTEEEAAKAYDVAAKRLHGEFAALNFLENKNV